MRILTALLLVPTLALGAGNDLLINQRNPGDTATLTRAVVPPGGGGANGLMGYAGGSNLPVFYTVGAGISLSGGALVALPQAWASITGKPTTLAGYGITDGVTSITAGTGLAGSTITTTGTISMPNVGTAGTYTTVTTDAQGRVTAGTARSINDAPARTLATSTSATGFQVSATRVAQVCYEGAISTTSTIGGPSAASVFLETADTNSTTPGDWTVRAQQTYSNTITLAVVLNQVQGNNWSFCRYIPAGKFVRIRAGSITGTASVSLNTTQQEVLQ